MKCSANGAVLSTDVKTAFTLSSRSKGLLGRSGLKPGESLLIKPCAQIHTFFMKFPIAAVFLDKNNRILYLSDRMPPWRISPLVFGAGCVLELASGSCGGLKKGDRLEFSD
ncbi:MAG: DUF192 domain-containing protein [Elusimicrobiaceae bacterium]|nr:DUF192 domain-containing protein [Elusimicrobiaceae bacterium]